MASGHDDRRLPVAGVVAGVAASAALFYFGTGLEPIGWLTWLAPLPLLVIAPRVGARVAGIGAFAAYLVGTLNIAGYYLSDLELPVPLVAGMFIGTSAIFGGAVLAFRALLVRRRPLLASVTFAAVLSGAEYLVATLAPGGANWSLAPSQADLLVVLQIASLTGIWGVSFLVMVVPAGLAAMVSPCATTPSRLWVGVPLCVVLAAALTYGVVRLEQPADEPSLRVALLAADLPTEQPIVDLDSGPGQDLLDDDIVALRRLPSGTQVAVLPEKDLRVSAADLPALSRRFASVARSQNLTVVAGVESRAGGEARNQALIFAAGTGERTAYTKQYLLPGAEDGLVAGDSDAFVPGFAERLGVAICADMGHPDLGRSYAGDGARMMLVPALDFTVDAESQSRVQYLRGVENGFSVARASRLGYLSLVDPYGRVLEQVDADGGSGVSRVVADLPFGSGWTLYTRWGDWFAWVCLAVAAVGIVLASVRPRRRRPDAPAGCEPPTAGSERSVSAPVADH